MGAARDEDVLRLLGRQHKYIGGLFSKVEMTHGEHRRAAFEQLVRLLAVHETAEEEVVHPALRGTPEGDKVVEERLAEERSNKELLTRLDETGPDAPGFDEALRDLHHAVLLHAAHEERHEFPLLRQQQSDRQRRAMAATLRTAEAAAPTHPRPGVESATGNLMAGPFLAVADRVRDAIHRAGTGSTTGTEGRD